MNTQNQILSGLFCLLVMVVASNARVIGKPEPKPLPVPNYVATYFGGDANESCWGVTLDSAGNVYVSGYTLSTNFPAVVGTPYSAPKGKGDLFVLKFDPDLKNILAAARIGGSEDEVGYSIQYDQRGFIYIAGYTNSSDFPVTPAAYGRTYRGGEGDAFLLKMNCSLDSILAATFLGGSGDENDWYSTEILLDGAGNVYLAGNTSSTDFPTTPGAYRPQYHGGEKDIFISKFDSDLKNLIASTFVGGAGNDHISRSFCFDHKKSEICIGGTTTSPNFPVSPNAYSRQLGGKEIDGFIAKLTPDLARLTAATILPAGWIYTMFIHENGDIYVGGHAMEGLPLTPKAYYRKFDKHFDQGFISCFNNDLTTLKAATILPGVETLGTGGEINALNLTQSRQGEIISAGWTKALDFPATPGAFDETPNGGTDAYLLKMDKNLAQMNVATFIGGSKNERWNRLVTDKTGNLYLTSYSFSTDFPTTPGAASVKFNGGGNDGFLVRIAKNLLAPTPSEFHHAAKRDDLKKVKALLSKHGDLLAKTDQYHRTALHSAARYGALAVCKYLIEKGAPLNAKDEAGNTPLHLAVLHAQNAATEKLLNAKPDLQALNNDGASPLSLAVGYGTMPALTLLLSHQANCNIRDQAGNTLLHLAATRGNLEKVQAIIKCQSDIEAKNNAGETPLLSAVKKEDNEAVLGCLLDHGANINAADSTGKTLLHLAYSNIKFLLQKGAVVNSPDRDGNTPLHLILTEVIRLKVFFPPFQEKISSLMAAGADPLIQNKAGKTVLDLAQASGVKEAIEFLKQVFPH